MSSEGVATHRWTSRGLTSLVRKLVPPEIPFDLSVTRPPEKLAPRHRPFGVVHPEWGAAESLGYDAIREFPTMVVLALFTDVAVDYWIREQLVPRIAERMQKRFRETVVFYDGNQILRKEAAVYAGLGHIGKNSLLFSRKFGFNAKLELFLSTVEFDRYACPPLPNWHLGPCATCNDCVIACPVGAFDDYAITKVKECDEHITPKWHEPEKMCRKCITSCVPSNTLLQRVHAAGAPKKKRLDGIADGEPQGTAEALYQRIPKVMQFGKDGDPAAHDAPILPLRYRERAQASTWDADRFFTRTLPEAFARANARARRFDAVFTVNLTDVEGRWTLNLSSTKRSSVTRGVTRKPATCRIECTAAAFRAILLGTKPEVLIASEVLRVEGDRGNLHALHDLHEALELVI